MLSERVAARVLTGSTGGDLQLPLRARTSSLSRSQPALNVWSTSQSTTSAICSGVAGSGAILPSPSSSTLTVSRPCARAIATCRGTGAGPASTCARKDGHGAVSWVVLGQTTRARRDGHGQTAHGCAARVPVFEEHLVEESEGARVESVGQLTFFVLEQLFSAEGVRLPSRGRGGEQAVG